MSFSGAPAYERAEDPIFVLENGLPIDTSYYLENQLKQPLARLFEPILGDAKKILEGEHTRSIRVESSTVGIMKFAVKKEKCMGCKVPLSKTGTPNSTMELTLCRRSCLQTLQGKNWRTLSRTTSPTSTCGKAVQ